jgi:PPOX class probable F420-dependent enzyme
MLFDPSTPYGARVERRLNQEQVIWLTTTSHDGMPQPNPVWFLWDGETILIYSMPEAAKVHNIRRSPRVALHFDAGESGEDVVVITGTAFLDAAAPPAHLNSAYLAKYRVGIKNIEMTPESMSAAYNVAIRVKPDKVRGF